MQSLKILVVGATGVGKTCLLITCTATAFPSEYIPTVFDNYSATFPRWSFHGQPVNLGFWDTACQADYDRLRPLSYPGTDVVLICFSIASPSSLDHVESKWYPEIRCYIPTVPILLVGTKLDLRQKPDTLRAVAGANLAPVSSEQGKQMCKTIGAVGYLECSALMGTGLDEMFQRAMEVALIPEPRKRRERRMPPATALRLY